MPFMIRTNVVRIIDLGERVPRNAGGSLGGGHGLALGRARALTVPALCRAPMSDDADGMTDTETG